MNNVTPTDGPRLYEPRTTCVRMWVFLWANRNGTLLLLFWLLVPAAGWCGFPKSETHQTRAMWVGSEGGRHGKG